MIIALTGKPGIGKTTAVKRIIEKLKDKAVGFYTEEIRHPETKMRLGFKVITTDGKEGILAEKFKPSKFKVGSYGVNVEEFERLVIPVLEKALKEKDKIIVIDEIGKMELFSEKFKKIVKELLNKKDLDAVITIPVKNIDPVVREIRERNDIVKIEITPSNRNEIPDKILEMLS